MGLAFATLAAAVVTWFLSLGEVASTWTATHWLFTYEFGIVKRGLVGTLLVPLEITSIQAVTTFSLWSVAGATAILTVALYATLKHVSDMTAAIALAAFVLTSPGTVQQWHYDLGRFDMFGFILLCMACATIFKASKPVSLITVFALSGTSILLHEAFFFWVAPMSLAVWVWRHGGACAAVLVAILLTALTTWISLASYAATFSFDEARSLLQSRADLAVNDNSLRVHYRSLIENVNYAAERSWVADRWPPLASGVGYLGAVVLFMLLTFKRQQRAIPMLLAGFAPLALFLFGHDQGRWIAMIACNVILTFVLCIHANPVRFSRSAVTLLCIGTAANMWLGPFGVTRVFPGLAW